MKVINKGQWYYFDIPLSLQVWNPKLDVDNQSIKEVPVWLSLPELQIHMWTEAILSRLRSSIELPICSEIVMDKNGIEVPKQCVQVSVSHTLPEFLNVNAPEGKSERTSIVYGLLPYCCDMCCCFGHTRENCMNKVTPTWFSKPIKEQNPMINNLCPPIGNKVCVEGVDFVSNHNGEVPDCSLDTVIHVSSIEVHLQDHDEIRHEVSRVKGKEKVVKVENKQTEMAIVTYQPTCTTMTSFFEGLRDLEEDDLGVADKNPKHQKVKKGKNRGREAPLPNSNENRIVEYYGVRLPHETSLCKEFR